MTEQCVVCGAEIPEGRQVCPMCACEAPCTAYRVRHEIRKKVCGVTQLIDSVPTLEEAIMVIEGDAKDSCESGTYYIRRVEA